MCEDKRRLVSLEVVEVLQHMLKFQILSHLLKRGAAVAQWICLCHHVATLGSSPNARQLHFYHFCQICAIFVM